ncbi:MAG: translation initiation factor IF-2 [Fimbriimonas ginsengisoli]|uniref:Translation initiation factor IF-2 n=1 Tax=Fimbriimonas ginsengisoli TaxID=1005039 RepID=A0A931LVH6_FIMGI|nr:translation initiation factor IF-2 [Fimbriimonas ginsengisoli]
MTVVIADLAKEFEILPGQVSGTLDELGLAHEGGQFESDPETLELVREALTEVIGTKNLTLQPGRTPRDIATALGMPQQEIQKTLMLKMGVGATITTALKDEVAEQLVQHFGYAVTWATEVKPRPRPAAHPKPKVGAQHRPPVVTIMGHVDHGKTSLLDFIRKTSVASHEHGGITQHIGAYQVVLPEGTITFLDTPGHAAFTAMRARGAQVTDIAVLVVAADDGIMPQTKEAISHARNAGVPIIVAVNKIDKQGANPDRVLQQLPEQEVIPEAFGGQTIVCPVSALTGEGVPHLLEMILLQAGVLNLTADPKGKLEGAVIESKLEKGRGPVATVLVQEGTLRVGDTIVVGHAFGRVKAMTDYRGERMTEAAPSTPVEVLGLSEVPAAGDAVEPTDDERTAREIATGRSQEAHRQSLVSPSRGITLSELRERLAEEETKELRLIVKADVHGSVEAVRGLVEQMNNPEVEVRVIHSGVGSIVESDILLANAAGAICVGFNTKPEPGAKKEAERRKVEIRTYTIIYELIEDIEKAVKGMLEPKYEESYLGTVDIRVRFDLSKKGIVAGCYVSEGKVVRNASCRVSRDGEVVFSGKIGSLRHLKDDVREVTEGMECGVTFDGWDEFKEGDKIEAFEQVLVNA